MRLNDLIRPKGSVRKRKIVGRGIGSGHGKTSCKGHKGQLARAGSASKPGLEGGQVPLIRRIPKRGFNNDAFRQTFIPINVVRLNCFNDGDIVNAKTLKDKGILRVTCSDAIKVLGHGELKKRLNVQVAVSNTAKKKILDQGGSC